MLVAVVFHHHQPWYIDMEGRFAFGWIFDHTRNYQRHLGLIREKTDLRLTYNISPTLISQWKRIREGNASLRGGISVPDLGWQQSAVSDLLSGYRERNGKNIEVLSQPFYHPIMPLLDKHRLASDLDWHLTAGRRETEEYTGGRAEGMWSPECAFSVASASAMAGSGFRYTVLDRTALPADSVPDRPFEIRDGPLVFFRDNEISNAFSFTWPMQKKDVMRRELSALLLSRRREGWKSVVIALDGENWMTAEDHLGALSDVLLSTAGINSATLSELTREIDAGSTDAIPDTSWALDHTFSTWEGSRAKDQHWSLIDGARDAIQGAGNTARASRAREYLLIAEGSDYTYWDFDRPGALALFGMSYATAAREIALGKTVSP